MTTFLASVAITLLACLLVPAVMVVGRLWVVPWLHLFDAIRVSARTLSRSLIVPYATLVLASAITGTVVIASLALSWGSLGAFTLASIGIVASGAALFLVLALRSQDLLALEADLAEHSLDVVKFRHNKGLVAARQLAIEDLARKARMSITLRETLSASQTKRMLAQIDSVVESGDSESEKKALLVRMLIFGAIEG